MKKLATLFAFVLLTLGCAASTGGPSEATKAADVTAHQRLVGEPVPGQVTKVLVFFEENHSLAQMKAGMPFAYSLAKKYGHATNFVATTHPSGPNYIAAAAGSTMGVKDNGSPSTHKIKGQSIFGQAIAAGKTANVFAQSAPRNCAQSNAGKYAVRHTGWAYFVDERALCNSGMLNSGALDRAVAAGALPNVGWAIPNNNYNGHDASLKKADDWFKANMQRIFASPDWKSGHLAVILTADEDDKKSGNKVLTVVVHPSVKNKVVTSKLTHYSITRLFAEITGTVPLGAAKTAPSIATAFNLPVSR